MPFARRAVVRQRAIGLVARDRREALTDEVEPRFALALQFCGDVEFGQLARAQRVVEPDQELQRARRRPAAWLRARGAVRPAS